MGAESFRQQLQRLLDHHGWKLPRLAKVAGYNRGYLWEVATGLKRPSSVLVADLDKALAGGGTLVTAWEGGDGEVDRRELLRDLGALALLTPLAGVESIRQDLTRALAGPTGDDSDQWEEIVDEYAQTFYLTTPGTLLRDLLADITVLEHQLAGAGESQRASLARSAGHLAAITAMTWASLGQQRQARRWWQTARQAADRSGDTATRVWVRGWEVANGLYEQRPVKLILDRAAEARAIAADRVDAGAVGLYAGLAQTLAVAGRPEAVDALHRVDELTLAVPAHVGADGDSMFGWPEVRLRHTESYVYTALGDTSRAYAAQDAALALYGAGLARERAAMLLHRAHCMIKDGDVSGGIGHAHNVLDQLPAEHHTHLVYAVARDVLSAVPGPDQTLAVADGLRERLTLPASRA